MTLFYLVRKNVGYHLSSSLLSIILCSLGIATLCLILLASTQLNEQLEKKSRHIDLVVGAKGSPLQLILNSVYHVDNPTGNISLKEAHQLSKNPFVKIAVPLAMGDNYQGYRIIGTDSNFLKLYQTTIATGRWFTKDFEIVVGASVARKAGLQIGDKVISAHGLSSSEDLHKAHPYLVVGILGDSKNIPDNLLLTKLTSIWHMHDHIQHEGHAGEEDLLHLIAPSEGEEEITSLLIQYKNPAAIATFPQMVNKKTNLQAASPAIESSRIFSLLGIGFDSLQILSYLLMVMAGGGIFINLLNNLKNRKYELAIMRTMGASRINVFMLTIIEGTYITFIGTIMGLLLAHLTLFFITIYNNNEMINPFYFIGQEILIVLIGCLVGFIAALLPAMKSYSTQLSETLAK